MPECIVCKGYYDPDDPNTGTECQRCDSDNIDWEEWRNDEPVEQGGLRGLFHFTKPHGHLPFFITLVALALGLMGMGIEELWEEVNLFACLLATVVSVGLSLLILLLVYLKRHKLREDYLLERVKTAVSKKKPKKIPEVPHVKVESRFALALVAVAMLITLVACVLVSFDIPWKLSALLFMEERTPTTTPTPAPGTTPTATPTPSPTPTITGEAEKTPARPGLAERVKRAVPLIFISGYVVLFPALVYSSSMLLAQTYTKRMNQKLPHPIFLQDEKLARVVRREAEVELGRLDPEVFRQDNPGLDNVGLMAYGVQQLGEQADPQHLLPENVDRQAAGANQALAQGQRWFQAAIWIWDELERTDEGGIKMRIAREEIYQLPKPAKDSGYIPHTRVGYIVRADPWGRITEIKQDGKHERRHATGVG